MIVVAEGAGRGFPTRFTVHWLPIEARESRFRPRIGAVAWLGILPQALRNRRCVIAVAKVESCRVPKPTFGKAKKGVGTQQPF